MYYTKEYLKRAHREIDTIFRVLFPEHGMAVREEQIMLCHEMLDNLLNCNGGSSVPRNRKPYGSKNSNGPQNYTAAAKIRFSPTSRR